MVGILYKADKNNYLSSIWIDMYAFPCKKGYIFYWKTNLCYVAIQNCIS